MAENRDFRVISGLFKGQRLQFPQDSKTHPMGNREKLALFNMVSAEGATVLDIFAGSGALGIEALSRGAAEVVFVEKSPRVAQTIRENLAALRAPGGKETAGDQNRAIFKAPRSELLAAKTTIFTESAERFCARSEFRGYFSLILADPPYDSLAKNDRPSRASMEAARVSGPKNCDLRPKNDVFADLAQLPGLLRPGGHLVVSSPAALSPLDLAGLAALSSHTYAGARLTVYTLAIDK